MGWMARSLAIGLLALATPVAAQNFSDGYSFLKAVRDRDVLKAKTLIDKPASSMRTLSSSLA